VSTLEERSFADSDDSDRFAGTQADTLTSFVKTNAALVKVTAERNALRATLAKVAAIVADPDAALVVDRVRAALGLREQAASETEPVSSPELYPRNSMAVGSESMPNTNDHNDPEFGFDKTAALSDPGPERCLACNDPHCNAGKS